MSLNTASMFDAPTAQSAFVTAPLPLHVARGWSQFLGAFFLLFCTAVASSFLLDPDTQWHIEVGRIIWSTGQFPRQDTMSHTFYGAPWIAKEWLSQLTLYATQQLGGWPLVTALASLCAVSAMMIVSIHLMRVSGPLMAMLFCFISFSFLQVTLLARPHILALPLLALWTCMLVRALDGDRRPPWLALPIMVIWANLHAGYTIGFIVAGTLAMDAIINAKKSERVNAFLSWLLFGVLSVLASCINPYGFDAIVLNVQMLIQKNHEGVRYVLEWEPLPFGPTYALIVAYTLFMVAALAQKWRTNIFRILLVIFTTYTFLKHQRFAMLLAVIPPLVAGHAMVELLQKIFLRLKLFQDTDPLRRSTFWNPLIGACFVAILIVLSQNPAKLPDFNAPVKALASVSDKVRAGKVYNSYIFGGFLIINHVPTFIDGRSDQLFLNGFFTSYITTRKEQDDAKFSAFIDQHGVTWALIMADSMEAKIFARLGDWQETYSDESARVFVRKAL
jgi:hypothetical protein